MAATLDIDACHADDIRFIVDRAFPFAVAGAKRFGLQLLEVEAKKRPSPCAAMGICYYNDRKISIVFRYRNAKRDGWKWWRSRLPEHEIFETIAHELAHLRHPNHGKDFKALESEIKAWMNGETA